MVKVSLLIVEGVGLLLAFLDFFDVSQKIQAFIDKHRYRLFLWLNAGKHNAVLQSRPFFLLVGIPSWILFVSAFYALAVKSPHAGELFAWYLVLLVGSFLLIGVFLPLFYNALLIINQKGPGKTVGKISLGIALASSILQRVVPVTCQS